MLELKALEVGGQLLPLLVEAEALSLRLLARDAFGQRHGTSWNLGRSGWKVKMDEDTAVVGVI